MDQAAILLSNLPERQQKLIIQAYLDALDQTEATVPEFMSQRIYETYLLSQNRFSARNSVVITREEPSFYKSFEVNAYKSLDFVHQGTRVIVHLNPYPEFRPTGNHHYDHYIQNLKSEYPHQLWDIIRFRVNDSDQFHKQFAYKPI